MYTQSGKGFNPKIIIFCKNENALILKKSHTFLCKTNEPPRTPKCSRISKFSKINSQILFPLSIEIKLSMKYNDSTTISWIPYPI